MQVAELEGKLAVRLATAKTSPLEESAIGGKKLVKKEVEYHDRQAQDVISPGYTRWIVLRQLE